MEQSKPEWNGSDGASLPSSRQASTSRPAYFSEVSVPSSPSSRSAASTPRSNSLRRFDAPAFSSGQSLASVLNNPKQGKLGVYGDSANWSSWMLSAAADGSAETVPPLAPGVLPDVSRESFEPYLARISEPYSRFTDVRQHAEWEQSAAAGQALLPAGTGFGSKATTPMAGDKQGRSQGLRSGSDGDLLGSARAQSQPPQGEGLLACLREIPPLYFEEDFSLENGATFAAACPHSSIPANMMLQEKLSHYLDLVEVHLVSEISARSDSFFDALEQLEDLNGCIVAACAGTGALQAAVQRLDGNLVAAARRTQALAAQRGHLLALHQKLKLVSFVHQALATLRLLVAAADCAGALDVIDDLRRLLEGDELAGLHCFRHVGDQLSSAADSVNRMLTAEFVREAIHGTADLDPAQILASFAARSNMPEGASVRDIVDFEADASSKAALNGEEGGEEEGLRDQLLPIVVGLLRTSTLPSVLRAYRETLTTDIRAAIKSVVNEILPILFVKPEGEMPADMDGFSLAYKLRCLSSSAFVQLLTAVFAIVQARLRRAADVKYVVEQIIGGLQDTYAADAVAAAFAAGAAQAAAAAEAAARVDKGKAAVSELALASGANAFASAASVSKQFRADVLRENAEALWAACDAAHTRWIKLLSVRAAVHPRLKLPDFVSVYNVTNDFILETEKAGGRLGYSIRGTLQSQAKSYVEAQHSGRVAKIAQLLDKETWAAVDAPDDVQAVCDFLGTDSQFALAPTANGVPSVTADEILPPVHEFRGPAAAGSAAREGQTHANGRPEVGGGDSQAEEVEEDSEPPRDPRATGGADAAAGPDSAVQGGAAPAGPNHEVEENGARGSEGTLPGALADAASTAAAAPVEAVVPANGAAAPSADVDKLDDPVGGTARAEGRSDSLAGAAQGAEPEEAGGGDARAAERGVSESGEGPGVQAEGAEEPLAAGQSLERELGGNAAEPQAAEVAMREDVEAVAEEGATAPVPGEAGAAGMVPGGSTSEPVAGPTPGVAEPVAGGVGQAAPPADVGTNHTDPPAVPPSAPGEVSGGTDQQASDDLAEGDGRFSRGGSMGDPTAAAPSGQQAAAEAPAGSVSSTPLERAAGTQRSVGAADKPPARAKAAVKTLQVQGQSYHAVQSLLVVLRMLSEYCEIGRALPTQATEVVHRVAELLKLFNSRTCQLVLGAGAMQVSGLKSITAKHLALSSQCISLIYALIPDIKRTLAVHVPDARKALLLNEIDRVGQDYRVHREEIHRKLVSIMRERLLVHLRALAGIAEQWGRPGGGGDAPDAEQQPSQFARALTKEVGVLHRVLSPLLLESDIRSIFSRVVALFHELLAEQFAKIDTSTPQAKRRWAVDVQLILQCLEGLPSSPPPGEGEAKPRLLEQLYIQRVGGAHGELEAAT